MTIYHSQRQGDRDYQEDSFTTIETDKHQLLVVADGLGGHAAGDMAAKLIVELVSSAAADIPELTLNDAKTQLRAWFEPIFSEFQQSLARNDRAADAHTTVAIAIIQQDQLYTLTVGDSRIYLCSEHRLWRTRDHSVVQMLLDEGEISEAEMAVHPEQGKLYQSIGPKKAVKPRVEHNRLQAKDVVLAVSDGFWEGVSDDELKHFATAPTQELLDDLAEHACLRRAPKADNTTAICYVNEVSEAGLMKTDKISSEVDQADNHDVHSTQEVDDAVDNVDPHIDKDTERHEGTLVAQEGAPSAAKCTASKPTPDRQASDVPLAPNNKRRDRFIVVALLLFVIALVVWGGGNGDELEMASSEATRQDASSSCMIEEVYEANDNGIRIVLTSIDDGSEQVISLPIHPGKYRVKLEDRNGECQDLRDEQGEIELKRKFERQRLRSTTLSMEVL